MIKEIFAPHRCTFNTENRVEAKHVAIGTFSTLADDNRTLIVVVTRHKILVYLGIHSKVWLSHDHQDKISVVQIGSVANSTFNSIVLVSVEGWCYIYHLEKWDPECQEYLRSEMDDPRYNQINLDRNFETEEPLQFINKPNPDLLEELDIWNQNNLTYPQPKQGLVSQFMKNLKNKQKVVPQNNQVSSSLPSSMSNFKNRPSGGYTPLAALSVQSHESDKYPHHSFTPDVVERIAYGCNANNLELAKVYTSMKRMASEMRISMEERKQEEVENSSGSDSEASSPPQDDLLHDFKATKINIDGIETPRADRNQSGFDAIFVSTFDGYLTVYQCLDRGQDSSPFRSIEKSIVALKTWKLLSAIISIEVMGLENNSARRMSVGHFGGSSEAPASQSGSIDDQMALFPTSPRGGSLARSKNQLSISKFHPIPEIQEQQVESPKFVRPFNAESKLNLNLQASRTRERLESGERRPFRVDSFQRRAAACFNETLILVTLITGETVPFMFSNSKLEVENLFKQARKQSDMMNNPQILRAFAYKGFYRRRHEAQVMFLNDDCRFAFFQISCFTGEQVAADNQNKKKIGDVLFTKKASHDTQGWGVVHAQMGEVPIAEHWGPIKRRERCLIVALINKEILFIFKDKERWKLRVDFPILSFYFGDLRLNAGDSRTVASLIVWGQGKQAQVFYDLRVGKED